MNPNENNFNLLLKNLPDAFAYHQLITDEGGRPVDYITLAVNPAYEKMTGIALDKVIGKKISTVIPGIKDSDFDWIGTLGEVAINGATKRFVKFLEPLNRWYEVTAFSDEPGYFTTVFRDVSEQRKTEIAFEQEQKEKNIILNNLAEQIAFLDRDMRVIWANPKVYERHNLTPEELVGRRCHEAYHQYSEPCEDCPVVTALKTVKTTSGIHMSPDRIYWQVTGTPVFDEKDQLIGAMETALNVTDLIETEQALRASEELFRLTSELAPVGIVVSDRNEKTLNVNRKFQELFGYSIEEMPSVNEWWSLAYPDKNMRLKVQQQWKVAINNAIINRSEIDPLEFPVTCKDGTVRQVEFRMASVDELNVVILSDVSERKKALDEIRYISFHDSLTGLYNRAFFDEEMARYDTNRQLPVSVIMADLNGLKLVNDTYGHKVGDEILKRAADILRSACREEDIIARWGGDEFVILLPQTPVKNALSIAKRIVEGCYEIYVEDVPVSMALGVASREDPAKALSEVLREAEDAMYKEKLTESRSTKSAVLKALLKALEEKSFETEEHSRRMQQVARKIGEKLGLSAFEINRLELLITLHDIGKINISEEVLTKKDQLTEEEWVMIKKHPEVGYRIALASEDFAHVAEDILSHHERWDGSGYPRGLRGVEIPLLARITAIADAYEVMSNGRPYRQALSREEIFAEFKKCTATHFDPDLTALFLAVFEDDR
jgi:diguanylate cyclase (GGDEF)-like protein/PAS domain S-box-containing protein